MGLFLPIYSPYILGSIFILMLMFAMFARTATLKFFPSWLLVIGIVGTICVLRMTHILTNLQLFMTYGLMVAVNYLLTFYYAILKYRDPAEFIIQPAKNNSQRMKVHYVIPVYNERGDLDGCIKSVLAAAQYAKPVAQTTITVVNDGSTDDTWARLQKYAKFPGVTVMNLSKNTGKKGAITAGTFGAENWRDALNKFKEIYGHSPTIKDLEVWSDTLRAVGCAPSDADILMHTDSDSKVAPDYIWRIVAAFTSNAKIGAVSGHCDVWLDPHKKASFITKSQVAWYDTQCRIRKAPESYFGSVFCVVGPAAAFRSKAIMHLLPMWVDDMFNKSVYKGATDRMITLLVQKAGWQVVYAHSAKVVTTVPSNLHELRKQWVRWKQNFWRMLMPVWQYAWRTHPIVAYLTYSRLIVTILAPFMLMYHLYLLLLGGIIESLIYVSGIALMGSLFGLAYLVRHPLEWRMAMLRPVISVISAVIGSVLTITAFYYICRGTFVWREVTVKKAL